jgi:hypothetical protein
VAIVRHVKLLAGLLDNGRNLGVVYVADAGEEVVLDLQRMFEKKIW